MERSVRLSTDVHYKQTAANALLHSSSFHPPLTIRSIPVGQFLLIRHICDTEENFEKESMVLKSRFQQRGYSAYYIEKAYIRAKRTERASLLIPQKRKPKDQKVCFIITYNTQWGNIRDTFAQFWPTLSTDLDLHDHLTSRPQLTAKRAKTLGNMLVRSHYVPQRSKFIFDGPGPKWGSRPCGDL